MQAITIGLPTVIRQFSMAASIESANANPVDPIRKLSAAIWPTPERTERSPNCSNRIKKCPRPRPLKAKA
jgi:hypothetical protein